MNQVIGDLFGWILCSIQQFFSHVGTGLPVSNQYSPIFHFFVYNKWHYNTPN